MYKDRIEGQQGVECRYCAGKDSQGDVARQAPSEECHHRNSGYAAGERQDLK